MKTGQKISEESEGDAKNRANNDKYPEPAWRTT